MKENKNLIKYYVDGILYTKKYKDEKDRIKKMNEISRLWENAGYRVLFEAAFEDYEDC